MSYPEDKAIEMWEGDGAKFSILRHMNHYCGYVRFPARFTKESGYDGLLTYVPVHGGITYAEEHDDGSMVYGFDCAHSDDETKPELQDIEWLKGECQRMAQAISIAAAFEDDYLANETSESRANVIDAYHERLRAEEITFDLHNNFGALLHVLGGAL